MSAITRFIIKTQSASLEVIFDQHSKFSLSFEYLRVFSPDEKNHSGDNIVSHKKQVQLTKIESLGKHGYRFIFDDDHSAIYTGTYLAKLFHEHDMRWQHYLVELDKSVHSREASIQFKEV